MALVIPPLVSEHQHGPDTDCVGCSVVMAVLGLKPGICPPTLTEAHVLRDLAGYEPDAPTSIERIVAAARTRYHLGAVRIIGGGPAGAAALWAALPYGFGAAMIGRPANLPEAHEMRQTVGTGFLGEHCVYGMRRDTKDHLYVEDPEKQSSLGQSGFKLVYELTKADFLRFYTGSAAVFAIAKQ